MTTAVLTIHPSSLSVPRLRDGQVMSEIHPPSMFYLAAKRGFDVMLSLIGLIAAAPIMVLVAVWVRLDSPGPIVYRQARLGLNQREFNVWKFRTMVQDAEKASGPVWCATEDPRITRAGRILRKVYLDELPQLWNILRGDMSFVGPRPERPFFYPTLEERMPGFTLRTLARPGLTGLAQSRQFHHSSMRATRRKFQYDMFYLRHRNFAMDFKILCDTLGMVLGEARELMR